MTRTDTGTAQPLRTGNRGTCSGQQEERGEGRERGREGTKMGELGTSESIRGRGRGREGGREGES
eukprot:746547-Hanusia_phi.AAC.8